MRRPMLVFLLVLIPSWAAAQGPSLSLRRDLVFAAQGTEAGGPPIESDAVRVPVAPSRRVRNALIGGAIGTAAGAVVCTVISTIADDSASSRISTCTWKGYLLLGSIGFAAGFGIGLAI